MRFSLASRAVLTLLCSAAAANAQQAPSQGPVARAVRYDRDVRPILADRCFKCHGPDEGARKGKLRLDQREAAVALRDTGAAIVPGDPDASEVWRRITTADSDDAMPPKDSGKAALTAEERAILRTWIEGGGDYERHWSFVAPVRAPVPPLPGPSDARNAVDSFVRLALAERSLQPSDRAAPAVQLRRLFLTLTGLPPEPQDLAGFVADPSNSAYDAWVERLLTEEPWRTRYAERMASPWLDAARYADTSGIHMDAGRQMWPWRDWVLNAFRDNMPFDQFARDQLAGDLWPEATQSQKIATGFHRCHVTTDEGGAIDEEYLVEYAVDRVATTGSVFLGLTLGCARCHDHKYDPITQEDFFSLYAYFRSIDEPGLYSQIPDANRALEPFLRVPSVAQSEREQELKAQLTQIEHDLDVVPPEEATEFAAWQAELVRTAQLSWPPVTTIAATSTGGATLRIDETGAVTASGENPDRDHHVIRLRTEALDLRLLCLQALPAPERQDQRVGRAENGNAVLQSIEVQAISVRDPQQCVTVPLLWAWASHEQQNGDFRVTNTIARENGVGWAVDAHNQPGGERAALYLSDAPFGFEGGTEIVVTLHYDSVYARHTFARVRCSLGTLAETGTDRLPEASSSWFVAGPFEGEREALFDAVHGPESERVLDRNATFAVASKAEPRRWRLDERLRLGAVGDLPDGQNITYVARTVFAPTKRSRELSLGSDDGFRLFLDGQEVAKNRIERGAAPDQDSAKIEFLRGAQLLTMKIVNTGGNGGLYQRPLPRQDELDGDLQAALLPAAAQAPLAERLRTAWRTRFSKGYNDKVQTQRALAASLAELDRQVPRTMVMKERNERRKTYMLLRGAYDQPITDRDIPRGVPKALGSLPQDTPDDRRGLAQWITAPTSTLFARVQVNRLFETMFGTGIVRTSEDFGMQGEWPSNQDLLDWLAVEFQSSGYDVRHIVRLLAQSATFRQDDRATEAARAVDADNRYLSWYPRRRLSAEQLRDQALFAAGLLKESLGGPSVKPYQPDGLWQEVAMLQSNTRVFERSDGDGLFRRSLYTYYKRACPPPSMLTFDAPTRESCVTRRPQTNTPMQALVLWNDEQYVEAARSLAARGYVEASDDAGRIAAMFVRCTSEQPSAPASARLLTALQQFRARYATAPDDAARLLSVGTVPPPAGIAKEELAAFTLVASAILNLDATVCLP